MFAPAGQIVDEALLAVGESPICGLANRSSLLRLANRHRQRLRPAEPTGIDFDLNQENIPGRLQHEMRHSHGANNNWLVCSPLLFNLLQILLYTLQPSFGDPNSSEQSLYKIYIKSYLPSRQDFDDPNPVKSCGKSILYDDCSLEYRAKLSGCSS